jgi:CheY-like chemotaxis protein
MCAKLLIVDDNADNRELLVMVFQRLKLEGVEVVQATNGTEALQMVLNEKPAMILLDMMMPGLNGYDVCRLLKGNPTFADTHIIMLTAADADVNRKKAEEAGANGFMMKPFDIQALREQIRKHFALNNPLN